LRKLSSIKVRLRRSKVAASITNAKFQFHKGSIKTHGRAMEYQCFWQFQFHKGSIKTSGSSRSSTASRIFQFHKGSIKTLRLIMIFIILSDFNSIKVRLRHCKSVTYTLTSHEFQFHKGSIKTCCTYSFVK